MSPSNDMEVFMTGKEYEDELERMIGIEKGFMKVISIKKDGRKSRLIISCACGNITELPKWCFMEKNRTSCGCRYGLKSKNSHLYKHGNSKTRLNNLYHDIKARCYSKSHPSYKNYGGRGITICPEWLGEHGFENFAKWAYSTGYDEHAKRGECTIDRIDVNGDYEPSNCRWATNKEQSNNRRDNRYIELNGEVHSFTEWCDKYGVTAESVYYRMKKGMGFEEALKGPRRKTCRDMTDDELKEYKKKRAEQTRKWREEHKEQVQAHREKWKKNNPEKDKESKRKYEEKKKLERLQSNKIQ